MEIIIALFVFAVGILTVIRVITTNISIIDTMKIRIQAQSLAKEGIDIIFNVRDTNLARGMDRNCAYLTPQAIAVLSNPGIPFAGQLCANSFGAGKKFRVSIDPIGKFRIGSAITGSDFNDTFTLNQLMTTTGIANYTGNVIIDTPGVPSYFARYLSFSAVSQSGVMLDQTKLLKVTSHVLFKKGSIKGEATLESFIGAIKK